MSAFLDHVRTLVTTGKFEITGHALSELNNDNLLVQDIISGVAGAIVVETYPDYHKGPSMLVLQRTVTGNRCMRFGAQPRARKRRFIS